MSEPTAEENDAVFVDEDEMDEELAIKDDSGAVPSDTEMMMDPPRFGAGLIRRRAPHQLPTGG